MRLGTTLLTCDLKEPAQFLLRRLLLFVVLTPMALHAERHKQTFDSFSTPLPLKPGDTLVIGFLGGWDRWDEPNRLIRRVCLHLRDKSLSHTYIETVENHRRSLAEKLVQRAFDFNQNGRLEASEAAQARVMIYGQSLGGWATVRLSRKLNKWKVPVELAVQIDSVGLGDDKVPPNVRAAANLYQHEAYPLRGETEIRAQDPTKTKILGNWRYSYPKGKFIDTHEEPLYRQILMIPHLKMEYDPEVWSKVESLIEAAHSSLPAR
jgi:hypothetical protein